jgi:hypothetical protein
MKLVLEFQLNLDKLSQIVSLIVIFTVTQLLRLSSSNSLRNNKKDYWRQL